MGRKGPRKRIAPGVYADDRGIAAIARVGSRTARKSRERRFPADTDLIEVQRWQLRTKADLLGSMPARAERGSLAAAVPHYLATLTGRRKRDDQALLQHWINALGNHRRDAIARAMVKAQLASWESDGVAASSLNHRLRVLRALYRELDAGDENAFDPTAGIKKRREPEPEPRAISYDLVEAIIAYMPDRGRANAGADRPTDSQTKARARVLAWTGLPPAQVMKLQPTDVDWQSGTLRVTPRRKGKGTKARTIPLLPHAIDALRWFFACGAAGPFSTSSFYKSWMVAQRRLERALRSQAKSQGIDPLTVTLPRSNPYTLRHTFGTEAVRRSKNILGVQALMLHARVSTTERYLRGAFDHAAHQVIDAWGVPPRAATEKPDRAEMGRNRPVLDRAADRVDVEQKQRRR